MAKPKVVSSKFKAGDLVIKKSKPFSAPRKVSYFPQHTGADNVIFCDGGGEKITTLNRDYFKFSPVVDKKNPVTYKTVDGGVKVVLQSTLECFVTVNGVDIPIADDFFSAIEDLKECDGVGSYFLFNDHEFECAMIAAGLVEKNTRGSYRRSDTLLKLYDKIVDEANKACVVESKMYWKPTKTNIAKLPTPIRKYIESLQAKVVE